MDSSHSSARSSVSQNSVSSDVVVESSVPSDTILNAFTEEVVAYEKESDKTHAVKKLGALCTPESFVTLSNFDTPGETVYYILKVYADVLLVKGNVYDLVDDCVVAYIKYAAEAGFVVRRSCQKRMLNGYVDEVSKYNYKEFGDVVSFDATFKTNKYKMVFVPFIVIDNHRSCVTVGAGLLKNETIKSYIWLLKAFIKAFMKAPSIFVTDQDGAIRNAIETEFAGLLFFFLQICAKIYDETDFKEKLNKIVWNMYIGPEEFEYRWGKLMEEFKLENHKWLTKMFNIRSTWIPAYFIDSPLCGLMRTTSRSESENSFFSHFTNSGSTLMNFMNCFETAMEKQRHVQERMDHKTIDTVPKLKTFLKIERHASNVYTRSLFELVQKEIFVGLWHCQIDSKSLVEGSEVCIIKESPYVYEMPKKKKKKPQSVDKGKDKAEEDDTVDLFFKKDGLYKVLRNVGDGSVVCSCQLFVRVGILCKHIFCVFKNANVEMIPQQYILRRWTKNLIPATLRNKRNKYGEKNVVVENFTNEETSINKTDNLEQLVGVPKPTVVDVNNPSVGSTKGRRKLRTDHNKRTCPGRFEVQDEVVV
ncbi:FAR1-related sequence 5-like protein [Tanacetum coccineum]